MTKSFYFQHDYNSANDHKILFLRQQFGIEGYGIYWYIIEQLAQNAGKLPLRIIPVIAMQIQTTADKVNAVIRNYDLFTIEDDLFFSVRLMRQIEFRGELSLAGKEGAMKRWGKNRLNGAKNSPPISPPYAKGKERKGKESKDITDDLYLWANLIVEERDHLWEQMRGRKVSQDEMDLFLSVAIRNEWNIDSQHKFRTILKGFKPFEHDKKKEPVNKYKV